MEKEKATSATKKRKISNIPEKSTNVFIQEDLLANDIQVLLVTLMKKHLGIKKDGAFNESLTVAEKHEAGMRLGSLLNVVADGALLPLMNFTLKESQAWLPDGYSRILRSYVFCPSGFWTMAPLRYAAKFDPFLSLDCAPTPSTLAQSKERKGANFAIWQPWPRHLLYRRHQRQR